MLVALRDSLNVGHPGASANYSLLLKLLMLGIVPLKVLLHDLCLCQFFPSLTFS